MARVTWGFGSQVLWREWGWMYEEIPDTEDPRVMFHFLALGPYQAWWASA